MDSENIDNLWRVFEIHRANLQSVSKAQKFHLVTLFAFLSLVWGWWFVGATEMTIQVIGITIKSNQVWAITPFVVTLFSLALIGSINAAEPIWKRLKVVHEKLGCNLLGGCNLAFYDLDTNKNLFDYLTFLKVHPEERISEEIEYHYNPVHFLYPALLLWALVTTVYATWHVQFSSEAATNSFRIIGFLCFGLQLLFSVRRYWIAFCRFLGIRKERTSY